MDSNVGASAEDRCFTILSSALSASSSRTCERDSRFVHLTPAEVRQIGDALHAAKKRAEFAEDRHKKLQSSTTALKNTMAEMHEQRAQSALMASQQRQQQHKPTASAAASAAASRPATAATAQRGTHLHSGAPSVHPSRLGQLQMHSTAHVPANVAAARGVAPANAAPSLPSSVDPTHCIIMSGGRVQGLLEHSDLYTRRTTINNALRAMFPLTNISIANATLLPSPIASSTPNWRAEFSGPYAANTVTQILDGWNATPKEQQTLGQLWACDETGTVPRVHQQVQGAAAPAAAAAAATSASQTMPMRWLQSAVQPPQPRPQPATANWPAAAAAASAVVAAFNAGDDDSEVEFIRTGRSAPRPIALPHHALNPQHMHAQQFAQQQRVLSLQAELAAARQVQNQLGPAQHTYTPAAAAGWMLPQPSAQLASHAFGPQAIGHPIQFPRGAGGATAAASFPAPASFPHSYGPHTSSSPHRHVY